MSAPREPMKSAVADWNGVALLCKAASAAGATAFVISLAAGCGGSAYGSHPAVPSAFGSKASAACKKAVAQKNAEGAFPYPEFNPTRPDWSRFPGVARALTNPPIRYRAWQRDMQALGEPSTARPA